VSSFTCYNCFWGTSPRADKQIKLIRKKLLKQKSACCEILYAAQKENPDFSHHQKLCSMDIARCHTDVTRTTTSPELPSWPRSFRGTSPGQRVANQRLVHGCGASWVGGREGPSGPKVARGNQSVLGATCEEWPMLVSSRSLALS